MAVVRTVSRGRRRYHYLVQTYRWGGAVHRLERYLGTELPGDLVHQRDALEREAWALTWFRRFEAIRQGYASHRAVPPGGSRRHGTGTVHPRIHLRHQPDPRVHADVPRGRRPADRWGQSGAVADGGRPGGPAPRQARETTALAPRAGRPSSPACLAPGDVRGNEAADRREDSGF